MASGTISKRLTGVLVCRQLVKHTSASHTFPGSETSLRLLFYLFWYFTRWNITKIIMIDVFSVMMSRL